MRVAARPSVDEALRAQLGAESFDSFTPERARRVARLADRVDCRIFDDAASRIVPAWREVVVL